MSTGIIFRIIENDKKVMDTSPISIILSEHQDAHGIIEQYNRLKVKYPNAEIIVICEGIIWETYQPLTTLVEQDIFALLKKLDETMRRGILSEDNDIQGRYREIKY